MEMHGSDAELVRRIRLYGLRHLRDREAAEDLVQNVLIVTLEALRAEGDRLAFFGRRAGERSESANAPW